MEHISAPTTGAIGQLLATIAANLVTRTRQAGMDRLDLARIADLNRNTVGAALAGGDIKLSTLIRLTRALGYGEWLQPLLAPPEPSPMEQLRASQQGRRRRRKRTSDAGTADQVPVPGKPQSRTLGRGVNGAARTTTEWEQ